MIRREFIQTTAATALAAGCARGGATLPSADELSLMLQRFDRSLEALAQSPMLDAFVALPGDPAVRADWITADDQLRSCMRSLYVNGAFRDMSDPLREHEEVQRRMHQQLSYMETDAENMLGVLEGASEEERRGVREELRRDPDIASRIADVIDERAALGGLSEARREQTRKIVEHATWRLRHQAPSLIVDEYVRKARRMAGWDPSRNAQESGDALSADQPGVTTPTNVPAPPPAAPAAAPLTAPLPPARDIASDAYLRSANNRRIAGGTMLGLGVVIAGASTPIVIATGSDALFIGFSVAITVGIVLFVLGVIFLIIGSVRRGRALEARGE